MTYHEFYGLYLSATDSKDFDTFVAEEGLPPCFADYPDDKIMPIFKAIWELHTNPIKAIKKATGFTSHDFSRYYNIPTRTIDDWARGERTPPEYVVIMLAYCAFVDEEII